MRTLGFSAAVKQLRFRSRAAIQYRHDEAVSIYSDPRRRDFLPIGLRGSTVRFVRGASVAVFIDGYVWVNWQHERQRLDLTEQQLFDFTKQQFDFAEHQLFNFTEQQLSFILDQLEIVLPRM